MKGKHWPSISQPLYFTSLGLPPVNGLKRVRVSLLADSSSMTSAERTKITADVRQSSRIGRMRSRGRDEKYLECQDSPREGGGGGEAKEGEGRQGGRGARTMT